MVHEVREDETWQDDPFEAARARLLLACQKKITVNGSTVGDNAFYGGCLASGKTAYYEYPCHYNTRYLKDCRVMFSRFVHPKVKSEDSQKEIDAATKAYFQWITGPSSPWREALSLGMSMADRPEFNPRWWYRYGFLFDRLDRVPANLLQSFLIATRMPKEWPTEIRRWYKLVKAGVTPAAAMFFEPVFDTNGKNMGGKFVCSNRYDWPLDHATCDEAYLQNFAAGVLVNPSKPWQESVNTTPGCAGGVKYWPVNTIFGNCEIKPYSDCQQWWGDDYVHSLVDRYSTQIGKRSEMPNQFVWDDNRKGKRPIIYWRVTAKEEIEIIQSEERRLGLV